MIRDRFSDLSRGRLAVVGSASGDDDLGAVLRHRHGNAVADTSARAGDDGDLAVEEPTIGWAVHSVSQTPPSATSVVPVRKCASSRLSSEINGARSVAASPALPIAGTANETPSATSRPMSPAMTCCGPTAIVLTVTPYLPH